MSTDQGSAPVSKYERNLILDQHSNSEKPNEYGSRTDIIELTYGKLCKTYTHITLTFTKHVFKFTFEVSCKQQQALLPMLQKFVYHLADSRVQGVNWG